MDQLQKIYDAIAAEGFSVGVLAMIDNYVNDIIYGKTSFSRFNLSEHAGVCTGGAALIGASVVACYARTSLEASANARTSQAGGQGVNYISDRMALEAMHPANVFIDEVTDKPICIDCIVKFV